MNLTNYVALDLETTGLDPQICDIIEIAAVKVRDGEIVDRLETFVFTPLEISAHVSYLTGITASDIEKAPDFVELIPHVKAFIGDDPLVGHNIWFDWNFLVQKGVAIETNELWDTYTMSNILYPELPSHSLETNTKYFGIAHEDSHRAMADVIASHELWKILIDTFPEISPEQHQQITALQSASTWPLLDFFLQQKPAHKHDMKAVEKHHYQPRIVATPDLSQADEHLLLHTPGQDPVDIARNLRFSGKTLYIAGYEHTRNKLQQAFPDAIQLLAPGSYLCQDKRQALLEKTEHEPAETMLLLKTILHPKTVTREGLILSHPERGVWQQMQTQPEDQEKPDNSYALARQASLEAGQVITSQAHVFHDLDYLQHFDQVVVLEPQFLEHNASQAFGQRMTIEQWLQQSDDEEWRQQGDFLFAEVDRLGNQLAPASQYPEHIVLTDMVTSSNEFIRLRSRILEQAESVADESLGSYLKYYQAFFQAQDPSWVRWFTVDPRRGVSLNIAPLSVKGLLDKHLFQKATTFIVSETSASFPFLPDLAIEELPNTRQLRQIIPPLEDISGPEKEGDHQAMISYLADTLPQLQGNIGVVFSSKAVLKRYFFALQKTIPEDRFVLGEDLSGGTGKFRDLYLSSDAGTKILFMTFRNMRVFAPELLDFDTMLLQSLPFDPPSPLHQKRGDQFGNAFMGYVVPRVQQNLLEILNNFSHREGERTLYILDRRAQEKDYGRQIIAAVE